MKHLLTTSFIFIFIIAGFSQGNTIILDGKIKHFDKPVSDVHIYNLNTKRGASTDKNGEFRIIVKLNDTLQISHLEYQTRGIIITEEQIKDQHILIYIDLMTNYLNTVELKNHNLTGDLLFDVKNAPKDSITIVMNSQESRLVELSKKVSWNDYLSDSEAPPIVSVDPSGGIGGSVGIPMKDKDGLLRRQLRLKKSIPDRIIAEFGKNYFINKLKIPEEKIYNFITYCDYRDILNLYENNQIMKIINIFIEESVEYNKIKD